MRRLFFIILGLIILFLVAGLVMFGLNTPEMPVTEVHKVISVSRPHQDVKTPAVPAIPEVPPVIIPYKGNQPASTTPIQNGPTGNELSSTLPSPGAVPGNALGNHVQQQ